MSDVNNCAPLQLIRLRDNVFEVPQETKQFLRELKNPLGMITIVGKYRTGKSLFLNKVLLKKSSFKVSPTINSCTKGLWMCRQTLQSQGNQQFDVLVVDTEGFGATEETDAYNNKILLFAILLSSYFVYNSVGSIDQNSINNLSVIANLAKDIQKNNSKDDKLQQEFPSFLWLVRDFTLNMVDKNGCPIQPKEYLEQALQNLKGNSDAIENKNKIRRMIKHFFKDRDCCTLIRPVQTQGQLQTLFALPDQELRPQFIEQANSLRSKILKRIKSKRIRGKVLDGQTLLELALSYVQVINKGTLPNFDSSYRLIMRFQLNKLAEAFLENCKKRFEDFTKLMRRKEEFDELVDELNRNVQQRFYQGSFEAEQTKAVIQKLKKQIRRLTALYIKANEQRIEENCRDIWQRVYEEGQFQDERSIKEYFDKVQIQMKKQILIANNPVSQTYYNALIEQHKCRQLQKLIHQKTQTSSKLISTLQKQIAQARTHNISLEASIRELKDKLSQATRLGANLTNKYEQMSRSKEQQIGMLRQREADNLREMERLFSKIQQGEKEIERLHQNYSNLQQRYQQLHKSHSQLNEDKRLLLNQLQITKLTLGNRTEQATNLKMSAAQLNNLLNSSKQRQASLQTRIKIETQNHQQQVNKMRNQSQKVSIDYSEVAKRVTILEGQLKANNESISRERLIYQNMFNSLKESLKSQSTSRQELIETNKNLSSALKHLENRALQAEEKEKQLKQYKRCVKNSSCLQCQHCTKFFVPSIFIPHLNICVIGPEALKNAQTQLQTAKKLEVKIKQTLIREEQSKPFTEYVIELRRGGECWTVYRKYKAFCDLNTALRATLPGVQLSEVSHIVNPQEFAKKSLPIQQRRRALQKYMIDLSSNPLVTATIAWKQFIEEDVKIPETEPLQQIKENRKQSNASNQQTPEQFFKLWNERKIRGKQLSMSKKFKPNA